MYEQLGVIGCGLMGGSFALAMKKAGLVKRVVGYSKSPSTTEKARQMGVIDVEAPSALLAVSGADIVLISVPVAATEATFRAIKHLVTPKNLIMDVGSTKRDVVEAADRILGPQVGAFVPTHPIAGKEVSGVEHSDAQLYAGKKVILTPTERTNKQQLLKAEQVWKGLGCEVLRMTPQAHDKAYAAISHLPHLLAFAYMNGLISQPDGNGFLSLAGTGFKDFTRIAASDPKVWRDIFTLNKDQVLEQSRLFRLALREMELAIAKNEMAEVQKLIDQARKSRQGWTDTPPA